MKETKVNLLYEKIERLIKKNHFEEALDLCNKELEVLKLLPRVSHKIYYPLVYQKISILKSLKRFEEALVACNDPKCKKDDSFTIAKIEILLKLQREEEVLKICNQKKYQEDFSMIYYKLKALMNLKRYDEVIELIWMLGKKKEFKNNPEFGKMERGLLNIIKRKETKEKVSEPKPILIKDAFANEVTAIQKYIYCKMQTRENTQKAILAWDRFETMTEKKVTDVNAVNSFAKILIRISKDPNQVIPISFDEQKLDLMKRKYQL